MNSWSKLGAVTLLCGLSPLSLPSASASVPKVGARCTRAGVEAPSPNGRLVCRLGSNRKLVWTPVRVRPASKAISAGAKGRGLGLVPSRFQVESVQSFEIASIPPVQEDSSSPQVPRTVLYSDGQSGSWSPDASQVVFYKVTEGFSKVEVWVVGADGTNPHLVSSVRPNGGGYLGNSPSWSADGSQIAFINQKASSLASLVLVRPDGTGVTELGNPFKETGAFLTGAVWSPLGRQLALTGIAANCPSDATVCGSGWVSDLYLLTPDDGSLRKIASLPDLLVQSVTWTPKGDALVMQAGDNSNPGSKTYIVSSAGKWFDASELAMLFPTYSSRQRSNLTTYWGQGCSLWAKGGCLV
jgi:hypothetical protein